MLPLRKGLQLEQLQPADDSSRSQALADSSFVLHFTGDQEERGTGFMESASPPVPFPLLVNPKTYNPFSMTFRNPGDSLKELTAVEKTWVEVLRRSIESFKVRAAADSSVEDAPELAEKFAERYNSFLDDFESDPESHGGPPDPIVLCRLRDLCLRELGFTDIFKKAKDEENSKALQLLPAVLAKVDAIESAAEKVEALVKGVLAGNIFDLGAKATSELFDKGEVSFESSFSNLLPRPWVIDDLEKFQRAWGQKTWKKVVIFCDNAGADVVLGVLPLARELIRAGSQVILAANDMPTINDITYTELLSLLQQVQIQLEDETIGLGVDRGQLLIVNSGNDLPVIDLAAVSPELAFTADDAELVVLIGMGRGIETNLNVAFKCDSLNLGMVKHPEVAEHLGGRLYDCVVKFREASSSVPLTPSKSGRRLPLFSGET